MPNLFFSLAVPVADGPGAPIDTSATGREKTLVVEGPYGGSLNIEVSNDGGTSWAELTTFSSGVDEKRVLEFAAQLMRVSRVGTPAFGAGSPVVSVGSGSGGGFFTSLVAPAGNGLSAAVDTSDFGTFNTVSVTGSFAGTVNILVSNDGTNYSTALSFANAGLVSREIVAQFMRVERAGTEAGGGTGLPVIAVGAINDSETSVGIRENVQVLEIIQNPAYTSDVIPQGSAFYYLPAWIVGPSTNPGDISFLENDRVVRVARGENDRNYGWLLFQLDFQFTSNVQTVTFTANIIVGAQLKMTGAGLFDQAATAAAGGFIANTPPTGPGPNGDIGLTGIIEFSSSNTKGIFAKIRPFGIDPDGIFGLYPGYEVAFGLQHTANQAVTSGIEIAEASAIRLRDF